MSRWERAVVDVPDEYVGAVTQRSRLHAKGHYPANCSRAIPAAPSSRSPLRLAGSLASDHF